MVLITAYTMLTIAQCLILILLLTTLGKMQRLGQFKIRNIILQFALFLVSFLSNLGLYVQYLITDAHNFKDQGGSTYQPFIDALFVAAIYTPIDIIPITFMLYSQHRTFIFEQKQRNLEVIASIQPVDDNVEGDGATKPEN